METLLSENKRPTLQPHQRPQGKASDGSTAVSNAVNSTTAEVDLVALAEWEKAKEHWPNIRNACMHYAKKEVEAKRKFGFKCIFENLRWTVWVNREGKDFKLSNNLCAAYARLLLMEYPEARDYMTLHKSKFDEFAGITATGAWKQAGQDGE